MSAPARNNAHRDPRRRNELAQIHIARAQLGLDESTYRDMLWAIGRVRSAGELDFAGRQAVLEHLRSRGFRPTRSRKATFPRDRKQRKILALWLALRDAGKLEDGAGDEQLAAFARRQTGIERLEWITGAAADKVIEGLKAWERRKGVPDGHVS